MNLREYVKQLNVFNNPITSLGKFNFTDNRIYTKTEIVSVMSDILTVYTHISKVKVEIIDSEGFTKYKISGLIDMNKIIEHLID